MAFPQVQSVTETIFGSDTTSHNVDMPATVTAGDLLVCLFTNDGSATVTPPSGWFAPANSTASSAAGRGTVLLKLADGTEDGTTVDFVTSASEQAAAQVYRITAWDGDPRSAVRVSNASSSGASPTTPSLTAPWGSEDTLWISYLAASDADSVTTAPTNYTNIQLTNQGGGTASGSVASARRELATATEDPGTFTASASITYWGFTIGVRPAQALLTDAPVVTSVTETIFSSDATSHNVAMPATTVAGELLLLAFTSDAAPTITDPSGWTMLYETPYSTAVSGALYAKEAAGTEGGTTVDVVTSSSEQAVAQVFRITDWFGDLAGVEVGTAVAAPNTGVTTADAGTVTASWGADTNLFIAFHHASSGGYVNLTPTGYGNTLQTNPSVGTSAAAITSTRKGVNGATETPADWGASTTTINSVTNIVVIRPVGVVPADLVLSASAGVATATLVVSTSARLTLSTAAGVAAPTLALRSPALLSLSSSPGVATATMRLQSPTFLVLSSSAGVATSTLNLASPTFLVLSSSPGVATATLSAIITVSGDIGSLVAAGLSSAAIVVATPTLLSLSSSAGIATAALAVRSPALLALTSAAGVATAASTITTPVTIIMTAAGVATAAALVKTDANLILSASAGVATAAAAVTSLSMLTLSTAAGIATAAATVIAPSLLTLSAVAGLSTSALTVISPALLTMLADGLSTASLAVKSPALLTLTSAGVATALATLSSPALLMLSTSAGVGLITLSEISLGPSTKARIGSGYAPIVRITGGTIRPVIIQAGTVRPVRINGGY